MTTQVPESPAAVPLPMFWPVMAASALFESGLELAARNLKYLAEEAKLNTLASLVLAGAPIGTDAGEGPIKTMAHTYPMSLYEDLSTKGGGLMLGRFMLAGWEGMHPRSSMCTSTSTSTSTSTTRPIWPRPRPSRAGTRPPSTFPLYPACVRQR